MLVRHRFSPLAIVLALIALVVVTAEPDPAAGGKPSAQRWTRTLDLDLSARRLGLDRGASPQRLARQALPSKHHRIGLARGTRVRLDRSLKLPGADGARSARVLRFQQSVGGLRLVRSQIDVSVVSNRVRSIKATVVQLRGSRKPARATIGRSNARAIARAAVPGALRPLAAADAGNPTDRPARARRVCVVEVQPPAQMRPTRCSHSAPCWCSPGPPSPHNGRRDR